MKLKLFTKLLFLITAMVLSVTLQAQKYVVSVASSSDSVAPVRLTASLAENNNVKLTYDDPKTLRNPNWQSYAITSELTNIHWISPERATLFNISDFGLNYPAEISKVSHYFYEHNSFHGQAIYSNLRYMPKMEQLYYTNPKS